MAINHILKLQQDMSKNHYTKVFKLLVNMFLLHYVNILEVPKVIMDTEEFQHHHHHHHHHHYYNLHHHHHLQQIWLD